jgi:hypothetical protein
MSAPAPDIPPSLSTSGYEDGLGRRTLIFDREIGTILERLYLRPELAAFEHALRGRMELASAFEDERFARVRSLERDPVRGGLIVVSEFVPGNRVCDLLEPLPGAEEATAPGVEAALGFLLELLPALATLHSAAGWTHGAVGPGRTVLTPAGQVVVLDGLFGHALERIQPNRGRLWREFGIAMAPAAGHPHFDIADDIGQAVLTAVMIVIGRLLGEDEYPDGLPAVVAEVVEIAQISGTAQFATALHQFLRRTLPLPGRRPYATADEAATALRNLAREIGIPRCRAALAAFVDDTNRMRETAAAVEAHGDAAGFDSTPFDETAVGETGFDTEETADALSDDAIEEEAPDESALAGVDSLPAPDTSLYADEGSAEQTSQSVDEDADALAAPEAAWPATEVEEAWPASDVDEAAAPMGVADAAPEEQAVAAETTRHDIQEDVVPVFAPIEATGDAFIADGEDARYPASAAAMPWDAPATSPESSERDNSLFSAHPAFSADPAQRVAETVVDSAPAWTADALASVRQWPEIREEASISARGPAAHEEPPSQLPEVADAEPEAEVPEWKEAAAVPEPEPVRNKSSKRQKRRGAKSDRDKLRSIGVPAPVPVVAAPVPAAAPPPQAAIRSAPPLPGPAYAPVTESRYGELFSPPALPRFGTPASGDAHAPAPIAVVRPNPTASIGVKSRSDTPAGYAPIQSRAQHVATERHEVAYNDRRQTDGASSIPWKLAAVASVIIAAGILFAGRHYLVQGTVPAPMTRTPEPAVVIPNAPVVGSGSLEIVTEPPGAKVLVDGKPAGESPLTLDSLSAGRHTLTFITASGTVRKTVRIEAGKTAMLDVPVYSGWVAVFAPIPLDIAENGRSIGTTDQGRLMLSPGRHELTLRNRELGYKSTQTVEIEPGEEKSLNLQPTGELSVNALPWAEVWIDGQKAGDTPIANLKVPLGTHQIVFKNPQFPDRRVTTTVTASAPVISTIDFTKPD